MKVSVVRPGELGPLELDRWRAFQRGSPELSNPFLAPELAVTADRILPNVRVAVLEDAGAGAVGFLAFERHALGVGKPVGTRLSDRQALIHAPGLDWDPRTVLRGAGLAVLEFDGLLPEQALPSATVQRRGVIDLSRGYEQYLTERREHSKKLVKTTMAKARRLEHDVGPVRVDFASRDAGVLRTLMRWKSAQYRRTGRYDCFARQWIVDLVEELFRTRGAAFAGVLSALYAGDALVAAHFMLRSRAMLCGIFPAYDPAYAAYSPGLLLRLRQAEAAAGAGLDRIELGKGSYDYKDRLKSRDALVAEGCYLRPSVAAAAYQLRHTPARRARNLILETPRLRQAADRALRLSGGIRVALERAPIPRGPRAHPGPRRLTGRLRRAQGPSR